MSADLIVTLIYSNETTKAQFGQVISGLKYGFVPVSKGLNGDLIAKIKETGCDAIIYEVDDVNQDSEVISLVAENFRSTPIYAAQDDVSVDVMRSLMRVGVSDVFSIPPAPAELSQEFKKIQENRKSSADERKGHVVSVLNGKSGSGATTVAVNLATDLASQDSDLRVGLFDFDIQFGSISLYLDVKWQSTIMEAVGQADRLDKTMLKAMLSRHDSGLYVLPAPSRITRLDKLTASDVRKVIDVARDFFDVLIIDLPRALNEWSEEILRLSDTVFLVIQRSLAILRDARLLTTYFPTAGIDTQKITVVENRCRSKHSAVSDKQIEETLRLGKIIRLANDYDAAMASQDHGLPLSKQARHSRLSKDIEKLSMDLLEAVTGETKEQGGLLGRFMGR
ncbi:MAG: AAA family ATPase [Thiohalomonadales bacterium]|nr:AAA family ATPase [Thiohalomonadales bacterium]